MPAAEGSGHAGRELKSTPLAGSLLDWSVGPFSCSSCSNCSPTVTGAKKERAQQSHPTHTLLGRPPKAQFHAASSGEEKLQVWRCAERSFA